MRRTALGFVCFILHHIEMTSSEGPVSLSAVLAVVVVSPEPGATDTAVVGQLAGVKSLVIQPDSLLREPFPTKGAFLLLDPSTSLPVSTEVIVAPEVFPTDVARKLVTGLMSQHMLV